MNSFRICFVLLLLVLTCTGTAAAQQTETAKAGVVRITAEVGGMRKLGSGFIVRLDRDAVYIVTAAHVVEGDKHPEVEFYTKRNIRVTAEVVGLEGGDPRGLALVVVQGAKNIPEGLADLPLAESVPSGEGGEVLVIGFPRGAGPWSVVRADIVSLKGRDIIFSGIIDERISGSPIIKGGEVVGLVTGLSRPYGRAIPSPSVRLFLLGWGIEATGSKTEPVKAERPEPSPPAEERREARTRTKAPSPPRPSVKTARALSDNTYAIPETGLIWKVIQERLTWNEAKARPHDLNKKQQLEEKEWQIPSKEETEALLEALKKEGKGPLQDLEGTYWIYEENYRRMRRWSRGEPVLFATYVDLHKETFGESNEEMFPEAHGLLLVRPINP